MTCVWTVSTFSRSLAREAVEGRTLTDKNAANDYSVSLVVFFITYVLFEVPSNLILAKSRPSIFLATIMVSAEGWKVSSVSDMPGPIC